MTRFDCARLSSRLDIGRPVAAPDGQGGRITGHEPAGALLAAIGPATISQISEAGRLVTLSQRPVVIRHRTDIRPGWRLSDGARHLLVTAISQADERGAYLQLETEERS